MNTQTGRSRKAKQNKPHRIVVRESAVTFFYNNAGFSYEPNKETEEQGKQRGAKELAKAEVYAADQGFVFEWEPDTCIGGDCGETETCEHPCCQRTNHEVLACILYSADRKHVLASLGSICEPSNEYRRVVEAELSLEAMEAK